MWVKLLKYLRFRMKRWFFLVVLIPFAIGCNTTDDTEKPTVVVYSPQEDGAVYTNDGLRVRADLSDNTGVLQYKITLNGIDSLNDIAADSTYSITYIDAIPGKPTDYNYDQTLDLPASTFNGHYQFTMACVDVEGNESIRDTVLFEIKNSADSVPPTFNVTGPTPYDTLGYGQGFLLGGIITDAEELTYSELFVGTVNFSDTMIYVPYPVIVDNAITYDGTWWVPIDSTWTQGSYHVYYTAWDKYSGVSYSIPFYVKY
ncbi:MAG: DUF4625 domain-containing protein [Flavobacteriales bacterium]|nr:DUF4625 domain-containing protein [Flavobacteriales bacterium]